MIGKTNQILDTLKSVQEIEKTQNPATTPFDMSNVESHLSKIKAGDQDYIRSWTSNPLMKKLAEKHTAAQDETSQINELAAKILNHGFAKTIGRSLCSVHYTDKESIRIRKTKEGKAKKVAGDTWSINTKGQRNEYVEVKTDKFLDSGDEWTTAQVEDTEYDYLMAQTQESMYNLSKLESEIIIAKIKTLESSTAGTAGRITKGTGNGEINTPTMDLLIQLRGKLATVNRMCTVFAMSENTLTSLLQDDDLKNSEYLTSGSYDYGAGMATGISVLGARLLPSSLMADNTIWAIDSSVLLQYVLRRDALIEPYSRVDAGVHGLRITSRYGLEFGRKDGLAMWF